jgi:hypothetical protein
LIYLLTRLAVHVADGSRGKVYIESSVIVERRVVTRAGGHEVNLALPGALSVNDAHHHRRSCARECIGLLIALLIKDPVFGCGSTERSEGNDELLGSFFLIRTTGRPHRGTNVSQFVYGQHRRWARRW